VKTHTTGCFERPGAGRGRRLACALSALLVAWEALAAAPGAGTTKYSEYEVKAAFLFNFMQFVEWPSGASTNAGTPLLIGVLGEDPFGSLLEKTIQGETLHGRPLTIKRRRQIADLRDCHLIFVCRSEKARLKEILGTVRDCPTLTVSDTEPFCRNGGMIEMVNEGGKIRFEINEKAAEQCGLKISSKLLRLARPMGK
jgi:hypothetical protein